MKKGKTREKEKEIGRLYLKYLEKSLVWAIVGGESFLTNDLSERYGRGLCMYVCIDICEKRWLWFHEKIHGQSPRISLSNYVCRRWGRMMGWGWKSLQDLCEKEEAARGASIIFSPPTASEDASIIHPSQSGIGRSLAGKLRENIRTTVDKLLTSFFCAGRVSRADISLEDCGSDLKVLVDSFIKRVTRQTLGG